MAVPASGEMADLGPGVGIEQVMALGTRTGVAHQAPEIDQIGTHQVKVGRQCCAARAPVQTRLGLIGHRSRSAQGNAAPRRCCSHRHRSRNRESAALAGEPLTPLEARVKGRPVVIGVRLAKRRRTVSVEKAPPVARGYRFAHWSAGWELACMSPSGQSGSALEAIGHRR